jgi:hypothetical protein
MKDKSKPEAPLSETETKGMQPHIAAVLSGKDTPEKLSTEDLKTAIGHLHRSNPVRIVMTDKCVREYHKRMHPQEKTPSAVA